MIIWEIILKCVKTCEIFVWCIGIQYNFSISFLKCKHKKKEKVNLMGVLFYEIDMDYFFDGIGITCIAYVLRENHA